MEKQWIYIIIILIFGVACLFFIVDSATTLGSANVYVDKFTVTIPDSLNVDESGKTLVKLINRKTNEMITIEDLGKGDLVNKDMSSRMNKLANYGEISEIENSTVQVNGKILPTIFYKNSTNDNINQATYFLKHNHTFLIIVTDFQDNNTLLNDIDFIINTLTPDYKQKQD